MSWNTLVDKLSSHAGSVVGWLDRHKIDMLCIQEAKVNRQELLTNSKYVIPGFDFYAAPNLLPGRGGNGVATLLRRATTPPVEGVDFAPLGNAALDQEGRCLVTLHIGGLAVVNVYVPNDRSVKRFPAKMDFLRDLTGLLLKLKAAKRQILLLGDFNIIARPADVYWKRRLIDIGALNGKLPADLASFASAMTQEVSEKLRLALEEVRPVPCEKRNWWTLDYCDEAWPEEFFWSNEECSIAVSLEERCEGEFIFKRKDRVPVFVMFEVLEKKLSVKFSQAVQRRVADFLGESMGSPASVDWLEKTTLDFGLVDSHLKFHESAKDRFTVWEVSRKDRKENRGFRLDYILADENLKLRLGGPLPLVSHENEAAALCANSDDTQFEFACSSPFRTGITYTPELYSDHVPVTAVIDLQPSETVSTEWTLKCAATLKVAEASLQAVSGRRRKTLAN